MTAAPDSRRHLRILIYANVERDEAGGAQAVVRSLHDYLVGRGHHVSLGWNSAAGNGAHGPHEWAEHFPSRAGQRRWLHLPTALRLFARLLRERPDVVHIHFASPSVRYFQMFASLLGYRTVLTCHGSDLLRPLPQDVPHLPAIFARADTVTAVSQDIAAQIGKFRGGKPAVIIGNGVDTRFWHPAPHPPSPGEGRLIAIGRLEQVKGFDLLIEALAGLHAEGIDTNLTLVGEGSKRAVLEKQVHTARLAEKVVFTGRLPREEIRSRLHEADLFVLPSRSEGTPLALLEAMATGTACLAASVGGVPATVGNSARLVAPGDPAALGAAIADLIGDAAARDALADAARERALAFCVDETHRAYEALMLGLAAEPRGSARPAGPGYRRGANPGRDA